MEDPTSTVARIPGLVIELVLPYVKDGEIRKFVSLACRDWFIAECKTRERLQIHLCYAASSKILSRRSPNLKHLKVKGLPIGVMQQGTKKWKCEAASWVKELAIEDQFHGLESVDFIRMMVSDRDLEVLARARMEKLKGVRLKSCSGFSTDGLFSITKNCRKIEILLLDKSDFIVKDDLWIHEVALHNRSLKKLSLYLTPCHEINANDLEMIASRCTNLVSVKLGLFDIQKLNAFFKASSHLQVFLGGMFCKEENRDPNMYANISLPPNLSGVGFYYMQGSEIPLLFPFADKLRELDLRFSWLNTEKQCELLEKIPNLEVLEVFNDFQDMGLEVVADSCNKLKRLRILLGPDLKNNNHLTPIGLISLAQGCRELERLEVYISTINNEALQMMGQNLKKLCDFRLIITSYEREEQTAAPLDDGVRELLSGCKKMKTFLLYLREGDLTDVGLRYVGQHSKNVTWMMLGDVGDSDDGLVALSLGCPKLQKLEMRGCSFSERAIATAVKNLPSLRFLWATCYKETTQGDLSIMTRPYWKIELIPSGNIQVLNNVDELVDSELLAYYSLVDERPYYPNTVLPFTEK